MPSPNIPEWSEIGWGRRPAVRTGKHEEHPDLGSNDQGPDLQFQID